VTPERRSALVVLRPGVRVVRRDRRRQQVGLDDLAVVVVDDPATDRTLVDLAAGRAVVRHAVDPGLLARLEERGLLVDPQLLAPSGSGEVEASRSVAAAYAAHGPEAARLLGLRRSRAVVVHGPAAWAEQTRRLVALSGIQARAGVAATRRPTHDGGPYAPGPGRGRARSVGDGRTATTAVLLLSAGEPRRADLDPLMQDGRPHLVVATVQGRVRVGPFVVPGVTACLRCVDAHASEQDPRRPLVLEQQAAAGSPDPVDPVLGALASATAVRDLVAWAQGGRPASWSATAWLGDGGATAERAWSPHPCCGCGWGNHLPL
ncbi:hypothetical protein, partial [Nocardioides lentus]